ncbi:MAG TPA: NADP-dependent oxidoreductase [Steroidobacteraceae bacterium]|nr:NADP-dependent oxidoreductase [Steroidobacteraceae bacterium]
MRALGRPGCWGAGALLAMGTMGAGLALAALPTMQRAIVQVNQGGQAVLQLQSVPVLAPRQGEVLVQVFAAAINPADWKSRDSGSGAAPLIPGFDVAGRVAAVGAGVSTLKVGEAVFGVTGRGDVGGLNGAYAQYVVIPAGDLVAKPHNVTYAQAAGLGVATLAGVRIVDQAHVRRGERVLITGVAGGVGSAAAQAAIARGALVIGTASARHVAYLHRLGVSEVIDYTQGDWAQRARAAAPQIVLDTVGADTARAAFALVARGGTFVSVGTHDYTPERCAASGVICPAGGSVVGGPVPTAVLLRETAELAGAGKLTVHVDRIYPLAQAAAAQAFNRAGHTEGKVVLAIGVVAGSR